MPAIEFDGIIRKGRKMPDYTFQCEKCAEYSILFFTMADYDNKPKEIHCHRCNQGILYRNIAADNIGGYVTSSLSDCKTIGQYAEKQTAKYSAEQARDIIENFKTKKTGGMQKLPKGMSRMDKSNTKTKWTQDQGE